MEQALTASQQVAAANGMVRSESRHAIAIPVRVLMCSEPEYGYLNSVTYDISLSGMRIHSVPAVRPGEEMIVERKGRRASYKIAWTGMENGRSLLGLQATGRECVWDNDVLMLIQPSSSARPVEVESAQAKARPAGVSRLVAWFGTRRAIVD